MPVQTTKKGYIFFPDGAMVQVKAKGETEWTDLGAINSSITATLNWDESSVETANAGTLDTRVSNMTVSGGFTLINLNPANIAKLGGGVFTYDAANKKLTCGSSTVVLSAYAMKIVHHTIGEGEEGDKVRSLELFSVYSGSGAFQFNFKGANEDGVEEMPLTFTAKLNTSLTDGAQLMAWTVEEGSDE